MITLCNKTLQINTNKGVKNNEPEKIDVNQ